MLVVVAFQTASRFLPAVDLGLLRLEALGAAVLLALRADDAVVTKFVFRCPG
jgi:hypothetical protein